MDWETKKCEGLIYLVTSNTERKSYVGLTRKSLERRKSGHLKSAKYGAGSEGSLQEAIRKYGEQDFIFQKIDKAKTLGELSEKECHYIEKYNTLKPNGYNHNRGGAVGFSSDPFEIDGEIFFSLTHLAEDYGIVPITMHKRVQSGWTIRQAAELDPPPKMKIGGNEWKVGDLAFISTAELCRHFKIEVQTFENRLLSGWTLEESCGIIEKNSTKVMYEGDLFDSLADLCRHKDVNYKKVESRLRSGKLLEQAINDPESPKRYGRTPIEIDGIQYESKIEAARNLNLTVAKLRTRLQFKDNAQTKAKLVELKKKPLKRKRKTYMVGGQVFNSIVSMSKHFGVNEGTIRSRIKGGKSIEFAVGIKEEEQNKEGLSFPLDFEERSFKSYQDLSDYYKISKETIWYRINKADPKWTLHQAVGLEEPSKFSGKEQKVQGEIFPSMEAVAKHFKVNVATLRARIRRGWTIEQAVGLEIRNATEKGRRIYAITKPNGRVEFTENLNQYCSKNSLKQSSLQATIKGEKQTSHKGYSCRYADKEETKIFLEANPLALMTKKKKESHPVSFKGKNYPSKRALCKDLGINSGTFYQKLNGSDGSIEEVVESLKQE